MILYKQFYKERYVYNRKARKLFKNNAKERALYDGWFFLGIPIYIRQLSDWTRR